MEILPALADGFSSVADVAMRGLNVLVPVLDAVFSALAGIAPMLGAILPLVINLGIAWAALNVAASAYAAIQAVISSTTLLTIFTGLTNILFALPGLFTAGAAGAAEFGVALGLATGGISLIIPALVGLAAALMTIINMGSLIDGIAMSFGDMGDAVNATAKNLNVDSNVVKASIVKMRDELGIGFEDATYIINTFGQDANAMADDVSSAMERLGVGVEDASMLVAAMGPNWEIGFDKIDAATKETGVGWQTVYDDLNALNNGMLSSTEIIDMMVDAADESPEAFARLAAELTPAEEAAKKLREEFAILGTELEEGTPSWVESVRIGKEGIEAELEDGTVLVAETADEMMGQLAQITEDRMAEAEQSVSDMIDGISALFDNADDARQSITDFAEFMTNTMSDVQQIKFILQRTLQSDLPTAWSDGKTANDVAALEFVNSTLEQFDTIKPGLLARGKDGGTGLLEGMESYQRPLLDFATTLAGDLLDEMTLAEAMRHLGYDGLAEYVDGIEGQEKPAHDAGEDVGEAATDGARDGSSGMYDGGRNAGVAWANGLRSAADYAGLMAWEVAAAADPALHGLSPPKEGPLRDIDDWGENIGRAWADGWLRAVPYVADVANEVAAAAVPGMGGGGYGAGGLGGPSLMPIEPATGVGNITVNINSTFPPTPAQGREVAQGHHP